MLIQPGQGDKDNALSFWVDGQAGAFARVAEGDHGGKFLSLQVDDSDVWLRWTPRRSADRNVRAVELLRRINRVIVPGLSMALIKRQGLLF